MSVTLRPMTHSVALGHNGLVSVNGRILANVVECSSGEDGWARAFVMPHEIIADSVVTAIVVGVVHFHPADEPVERMSIVELARDETGAATLREVSA